MSTDGKHSLKAWREECGVFGIWNHPEASRLTYLGLYALQHRGQESAGIVSLDHRDGKPFLLHHKGLGLVADVFNETELDKLTGGAAIGHNRYSTSGENLLINAQPLWAKVRDHHLALAHNGNIVNAQRLKDTLAMEGAIFQGTSDTECVLHLLAREMNPNIIEALKSSLERVEGAFSMVVLTEDKLIALRDPWGFRPMILGRLKNPNGSVSTVVGSESCAFDLIGATVEREIEPGEIFWIDKDGEHSAKFGPAMATKAQCVFEHVYFARPDSQVFGRSVYASRKEMGRILARENGVDADVVIPVPDSGVPAAIGYSVASGIPFELGIIRNHYVGRTFIEPKASIRSFGVKVKLNPQTAILKGKRVVVIDDSLVRGTTCRKIIQLVRAAGATEVHLRIAAPPTVGPCYYGVDTPQKSELIAAQKTPDEIREFVGADTLSYLSMRGLFEAVKGSDKEFCSACFGGKYPTKLYDLGATSK